MTCAESRDLFSARADGALSAAERDGLEAHLASCADCRREWQRFAATVGLLQAVEPARAPAGFVERVVAAARPQPWPRRLLRGVLVPWPVKLPLEAAAVVLVAGLAVLIFQRSPELQRATRAPEPPAATPSAPAARGRVEAMRSAPAPAVPAEREAPRPTDALRFMAPERAAPPMGAAAPPPEKEALQHAPETPAAKTEAAARRDAADRPAPAAPSLLLSRSVARPSDVEARLSVADRAAATREIAALVSRLGGTLVPPGEEGPLQIRLSREAYAALARELARLGSFRIERQPAELPASVLVTLRLTD